MSTMGRLEKIVGLSVISALGFAGLAGIGWVAWKVATTELPPEPPRAQRATPIVPAAERFPSGVNADVVKQLRPKRAECEDAVGRMLTIGLYKHESMTKSGAVWMQANEAAWRALDYDTKVRQALLVYCARMPQDGVLTVVIEGSQTGDRLGAVVDGNWMR